MRLKTFLALLTAVVGIIVVGVWTFDSDLRPRFVWYVIRSAHGYRCAETPEEAVAYFQKALRERDYRTAASYCSGDYKEWLEKGADKATRLGRAIDSYRSALERYDIRSEPIDAALFWLDPFPASFTARDFVEDEEGRTTAILSWEDDEKRYQDALTTVVKWDLSPIVHHSLLPLRLLPDDSQLKIEVRLEDDETWKVVLSVELNGVRPLRDSVTRLQEISDRMREMLITMKDELRGRAESVQELELNFKKQHWRNQ
jgi:hypothetical protein